MLSVNADSLIWNALIVCFSSVLLTLLKIQSDLHLSLMDSCVYLYARNEGFSLCPKTNSIIFLKCNHFLIF